MLEASIAQPAQQAYGRPGQPQYGYGGGGGGYPPQGAPPQQAPSRYYTPAPDGGPPSTKLFLSQSYQD